VLRFLIWFVDSAGCDPSSVYPAATQLLNLWKWGGYFPFSKLATDGLLSIHYVRLVRFGELAGLMWSDFDSESGRVIIRRQRSGLTGELTTPKTRAGIRWIDLPAGLAEELRTAHRLRTKGEFIFPLDERNFRSRVWHGNLRRAGLRAVRIHDARHTHASLLIAAGADVAAVSRRLGHSNPAITLTTYSHAFQRRDTAPLGERLATFMAAESGRGCISVVPSGEAPEASAEVVELMVTRGGIEPPTRGFSIHVPKRHKQLNMQVELTRQCPIFSRDPAS
jgi:hypothetical protein